MSTNEMTIKTFYTHIYHEEEDRKEDIIAKIEICPAEPDVGFPRPYIGEVVLKDMNYDELDLGEVSESDMKRIEAEAFACKQEI